MSQGWINSLFLSIIIHCMQVVSFQMDCFYRKHLWKSFVLVNLGIVLARVEKNLLIFYFHVCYVVVFL